MLEKSISSQELEQELMQVAQEKVLLEEVESSLVEEEKQ